MNTVRKNKAEKKKEPENEPKPTYAFADIVRGLQSAISGAQEMLQVQQYQNLAGFWDVHGAPVMQKVKIGDKDVEIPLLTLVPHSHLSIDDVEIKLKARVGSVQPGAFNGAFNGLTNFSAPLPHADLQLEMNGIGADDNDVMDVIIKFKTKDTPEALSRLMDEYNKNI